MKYHHDLSQIAAVSNMSTNNMSKYGFKSLAGWNYFPKETKEACFFSILHFILNFQILICLKHELKEGS